MRVKKKPVIVDAYRWLGDDIGKNEINDDPLWLIQADIDRRVWTFKTGGVPHMRISTLEGDMFADVGDFIIRGIRGELYSIKPDIFFDSYDIVDNKVEGPV